MSHKTEAEFWARACEAVDIDTDATGGEWQTAFDKTIADYHARGYEAGRTDAATDISATLDRLATAQEAANEQARIANLIALAGIPLQNGYENETYDARNAALFEGLLEFSITSDDDERCSLRPEIARALGIEVAE